MKRLLGIALSAILFLLAAVSPGMAQDSNPRYKIQQTALTPLNAPSSFTYQGRLMDGSKPANGEYYFQFRVFDDLSYGSQLGEVEIINLIVRNGLFNVELFFGDAQGIINGQARWLEICVKKSGGLSSCTILFPRQVISPVPYALSLVPGARSLGYADGAVFRAQNDNIGSGSLGLLGSSISPTGTGVKGLASSSSGVNTGVEGESLSTNGYGGKFINGTGIALYASGTLGLFSNSLSPTGIGVMGLASSSSGVNTGVEGESLSTNGYGGKFTNPTGVALYAAGTGKIMSAADIEIQVSPFDIIPSSSVDVDLIPNSNGYMTIDAQQSGGKIVFMPLEYPGILFGVGLKLKSLRMCYKSDSSQVYINNVYARHLMDDGSYLDAISDGYHMSTSWQCFTANADSPMALNSPIMIRLMLQFNNTTDRIHIGKTTLIFTEE